MLSMWVSFRTSSTTPLAPATRSSPPAFFILPEHMATMPIPVLSIMVTPERSKITFFSFASCSSATMHSSSLAELSRQIFPSSAITMMSGSMRFFWMLSNNSVLLSKRKPAPSRVEWPVISGSVRT